MILWKYCKNKHRIVWKQKSVTKIIWQKNKDGVSFASKYFNYDNHIQGVCAHRITPTQVCESSNVTVTRQHQLSQSHYFNRTQHCPWTTNRRNNFVQGIWARSIYANCCGWYEAILPHLLRSACAAKEISAIDFTAPHAHSGKVTKSKSRE